MLNDEQIESFQRDGFLAIEAFADAHTLSRLQDYYDRILDGSLPIAGDRMLGGLVRQVMVPSAEIEYFRDNPALAAGAEAARSLLNVDEVDFFFDMLISKEPGQLNETPWHNDYSYSGVPAAPPGKISSMRSVQFWVALDDVDKSNGCMQFIPGSHLQPSPEHYVASGAKDDPGRLLATKEVDPAGAIACPLPAGGATVHSTGTLHFTGGNTTADRSRRAYIFNYRARRPPSEPALHS